VLRPGCWALPAAARPLPTSCGRPVVDCRTPGPAHKITPAGDAEANDQKNGRRAWTRRGRELEELARRPQCSQRAHTAEEERRHYDWASLCRESCENDAFAVRPHPCVVFMGDRYGSGRSRSCVREGYVDRGVSGQPTGQMLVRSEDVIAVKPAVVQSWLGTNGFSRANAGPTTSRRSGTTSPHGRLDDCKCYPRGLGSVPPATGAVPWRATVLEPGTHRGK